MRTHPQLMRSSVRVLIALTALIVLVQVADSGQTSERRAAPSILPNASPAFEALELPGTGSSEHVHAARSRRNELDLAPTAPGTVVFLPATVYASGAILPQSVTIADVNGDGKPDLLVANLSQGFPDHGSVGVLLGNGDGTFRAVVTYDSGDANTMAVAVADVNGDGKPDLLVANVGTIAGSTVGVLLGNGDGTFQAAAIYASGGDYAFSVAVADVNGDGKPDLVVANCSLGCFTTGVVSVLLGNGNGTFQPAVSFGSGGSGAVSVSIVDVNGDGKPDLVVANRCATTSDCTKGTVGVLLGNGDGTFQSAVTYESGGSGPILSGALVAADVNGDGKPDLLVANAVSSVVGVLLGNGDGTFKAAASYGSGGISADSIAVSDVNSDGKSDLLVTNQCDTSSTCAHGSVGVLLGNGDGTFQAAVTFGSKGASTNAIAAADVNGDGKPDILVANDSSSTVGVLLNITRRLTATTFTSSLNPSIYGQKVTFTAKVTTSGALPPTGYVAFTWGGVHSIGSVTLNNSGVATLTRSNLNADSYPLTAVYSGDSNNRGSTSPVLNQVVLETTSAAAITASPNPSTVGREVTFTAKITSPTVTPAGPVTFTAGKTVLGTAQLSGGKATFTTSSLPAGSTVVTVTYNGDSNIAKSTASVTQVVKP